MPGPYMYIYIRTRESQKARVVAKVFYFHEKKNTSNRAISSFINFFNFLIFFNKIFLVTRSFIKLKRMNSK